MFFDNTSFDAALAQAAGDDEGLLAELRAAFAASVERQVDLLRRARCDGNWRVAADRLRGLGLSFHSRELTRLAETALEGAPGDPVALRRLRAFAASLADPDGHA